MYQGARDVTKAYNLSTIIICLFYLCLHSVKIVFFFFFHLGIFPSTVVQLDAPDSVLIERYVGRRIDPVSGGVLKKTDDDHNNNDIMIIVMMMIMIITRIMIVSKITLMILVTRIIIFTIMMTAMFDTFFRGRMA